MNKRFCLKILEFSFFSTSVSFYRFLSSETAVVAWYVVLRNLTRKIGAQTPKIDPLAHALRLTAAFAHRNTNTPDWDVLQIPAPVGKLGRLGPKLFTARMRKRKVDQPVRLSTTDVALGFVTLWRKMNTSGSWFDSCSIRKCRMGASFEALVVHFSTVVRLMHVSSFISRLVGGNGTPEGKKKWVKEGKFLKKLQCCFGGRV